jgi:hypothetical protein
MSTHSIDVTTQTITFKHIIDDIILLRLLSNTDRLQQVQKIWQRLYYCQILTAFSKLKNMTELVLLLPNSDRLQQVKKKYVRACITSNLCWPASASWKLCQMLCMKIEMSKTIYKYRKSVFDRSVISVRRLNWATQNTECILFNLLQQHY